MEQNSVFLLVSTDGYSINHSRHHNRKAARAALKEAWDELYDDSMDDDWKEQCSFNEDSAILYQNGENVFVWEIIEIPFKTEGTKQKGN